MDINVSVLLPRISLWGYFPYSSLAATTAPITELPQPGFGLLVVVRLSDAAVEKTALHRQLLGAPDQLMRHLTVRLTGLYCHFDFVQQALNEKNGSFVQGGVKIHNIQNDLSSLI